MSADQHDVRRRRRRHVGADEEARMRRLVVGGVLPGDRHAVLRIVHQRVDAVAWRHWSWCRCAARCCRWCARSLPRASRRTGRRSARAFDLVPLLDVAPSAVSRRVSPPVPYLSTWLPSTQLAHRVGVPPGEEVRRARIAADVGARRVAQDGHVGARAPVLRAGVAGPDVGGHAAARAFHAIVVRRGEDPRAGARVAQVRARAGCSIRGCPRSRGRRARG